MVHAYRTNSLFFLFLSFFVSIFFLLSFISFLFPYILFCDSSQMVVTVVLALFFPSCTVRAPFLQRLPLSNFTVLALNHLCLVWVYLPTTIRPSVCHSPSPNKEDYFVCQSAVAPIPATVWVSSFSLSLMACTQWLQLNFACLGGMSFQQDTFPKKALTGTSKQVFTSLHHQTMPSYI